MLACKFKEKGCLSSARVKVYLDRGCVCYPTEGLQYLRKQHYYRCTPMGSIKVIEWLTS